ncbi:MAG: hypothetical protein H7Y17_15790 [Chlorobia bacterium]|nr:hypothetical protein [Fimbriimonadaceae bacterium]
MLTTRRLVGLATAFVLAGGVALTQGSKPKTGVLLDLPTIANGKRAAIEKVFGKSVSSKKEGPMTVHFYKSKTFRSVSAFYEGKEFVLTVDYKPKDNKDWQAILAQFGLSVPSPRAVHKYFAFSDYVTQFNEIPQGTVTIWREEQRRTKKYTGWVTVTYSSRKGPPPD